MSGKIVKGGRMDWLKDAIDWKVPLAESEVQITHQLVTVYLLPADGNDINYCRTFAPPTSKRILMLPGK